MEGTLSEFPIKRPCNNSGVALRLPHCRRKVGFEDHDIIFEILVRLQGKSLMRFKCVSKNWKNLITDPIFAKSHFIARCQGRPSLLFELESKGPNIFSPERYDLRLMPPYHPFDPKEILICSNHCNGLVCLYNRKDARVYLHNITTGEIKNLPPLSLRWEEGTAPALFLGFDQATERYKLLHVHHLEMKILTLGTNSAWREISGNPKTDCSKRGIFLNGVLYWTSCDRPVHYFNFREEKFGFLSSPPKTGFVRPNKLQTASLGKLVMKCCFVNEQSRNRVVAGLIHEFVYDEVNQVFTKCKSNPNLENVVLEEAQKIGETTAGSDILLATSGLITTSASIGIRMPFHFQLKHVSRFFENIIPLTFICNNF